MSNERHPVDDVLRAELSTPTSTQQERRLMDERVFAAISAETVDPLSAADGFEVGETESAVGVSAEPFPNRRRWLAGVLSAAAVIAMALPVVLFGGPVDEGPGQTNPPRTVSTPTTVPTSDSGPGLTSRDFAWTQTALSSQSLALATAGPEILLISGRNVLALSNDDSYSWELRAVLDEDFHVLKLIAGGDVLVAWGLVTAELGDARSVSTGVFASGDGGRTWVNSPMSEAIRDMVQTPEGFVAVGFIYEQSPGDPDARHGALWESVDGVSWDIGAVVEGPEGTSTVFEAVVWDAGLTILGQAGPHRPSEGSAPQNPQLWQAFSWISLDGRTLSDPMPSDMIGQIESALATPHGIVALTYWTTQEKKDNSGAWLSPDGVTWSALPISDGDWEFSGLTASGSDIFIVGYTVGSGLPGVDNRVWHSANAVDWDLLSPPGHHNPLMRVNGVAAIDDLVVVIASSHADSVVAVGRR